MIAPGDVLQNRYRIERSIGRGGMGEVFAAVVLVPLPGKEDDIEATLLKPSGDSPRVAIKVVSRAVVSEAAMARLQREALAASRIRSPFVPELIEVGATPEGEVFLAMELLHGETLADRLRARHWLPWSEVLAIGDDLLSGLIDAHAAGVVHRDLKPSNIFLCRPAPPAEDERAKVLDFGVCKLDAPDDDRLTATGEAVGTAAYMAPEQIRGASGVTLRADLYSFATLVFEALSGQLPHDGSGQMAMIASKLERRARRLSDVARVPVPDALESLLARLLARDAAARLATAQEVRDAWRGLGPAVVEPRPEALEAASHGASSATGVGLSTGALTRGGRRTSRVGLALAALAVVVSSAVLLALAAKRPGQGGGEPPPPPSALAASPSAVRSAPQASSGPVGGGDGGWVTDDASSVSGTIPPPGVSARPGRAPGRPPVRGPTTRPHIADKPRY